jgi:hypothetical protein
MATKEECDRYAAQLAQRFEEYTKWAIANWPNKEVPLLPSDFTDSRKELSDILGPKLCEGEEVRPAQAGDANQGQYRDVNPMPWP